MDIERRILLDRVHLRTNVFEIEHRCSQSGGIVSSGRSFREAYGVFGNTMVFHALLEAAAP